jgi:hypothetical protein
MNSNSIEKHSTLLRSVTDMLFILAGWEGRCAPNTSPMGFLFRIGWKELLGRKRFHLF